VGLPGLFLNRVCRRVFLTDFADDVLRQCQQNVCLNTLASCRVRRIDWHHAQFEMAQREKDEDSADDFLWNASDLEELNECSTFLAADVIYSNEITDAFASQVRGIFPTRPCLAHLIAGEQEERSLITPRGLTRYIAPLLRCDVFSSRTVAPAGGRFLSR